MPNSNIKEQDKTQQQYIELGWNNFLKELCSLVSEAEIEAWVNDLELESIDQEKLYFKGLNRFFSEYVKKEYTNSIQQLVHLHFSNITLLNKNYKIYFLVGNNQKKNSASSFSLGSPYNKDHVNVNASSSCLNLNNCFERFVNGANTDIAFAAAVAVSENIENPKYNPLFLCGSVGLGKTHLMQAIGNKVLEKNSSKKTLYCSAEGFTNSLVEGIRFGKTYEVRKKFRSLDLLMIDDIQFLENKFSTQEELFHTLNELILNNKQVVISADRYPREIKNIEERLISRFSSGMVAKIEPPDFETRLAIVKNEVEFRKLNISSEVLEHIAYTVKTNVRDIKGLLTTLEAESSLLGLDLTLEAARIILKDVLGLDKSPKSIDDVAKTVANNLKVKISDIISDKREREISNARQIAMYIVREVTDLSYPAIARYFDKNHTSVIQACKKVKITMEESSEEKQIILSIIRSIQS